MPLGSYLSFLGSGSVEGPGINLVPVQTHAVETDPSRRARTLKHLFKANHVNHSVMYHDLHFHNHLPHHLGSAYLLGASDPQLRQIYESDDEKLEPWTASPDEIVIDDWRDYLGDKQYQRAYIDFFEDQLVMRHSYDWKALVIRFLFSGDQPLYRALISGREF